MNKGTAARFDGEVARNRAVQDEPHAFLQRRVTDDCPMEGEVFRNGEGPLDEIMFCTHYGASQSKGDQGLSVSLQASCSFIERDFAGSGQLRAPYFDRGYAWEDLRQDRYQRRPEQFAFRDNEDSLVGGLCCKNREA